MVHRYNCLLRTYTSLGGWEGVRAMVPVVNVNVSIYDLQL